jgi:hypothetical protein
MNLKAAIKVLIDAEGSLDSKLSLLTDIGLGAENEETFKATEELRHELVLSESDPAEEERFQKQIAEVRRMDSAGPVCDLDGDEGSQGPFIPDSELEELLT